MNRKFNYILLCICVYGFTSIAQQISIPAHIDPAHPRLLTQAKTGKADLRKLMSREAWAKETYETIKKRIDPYVLRHETDSTWIVSRLQMYWKEHYTEVFIKNGAYAYASGKAPVPTVRFTGTRDVATQYMFPKLENIKPYMDEGGKIYLQNKAPGNPWEWVEQSKTGRIIESINIDIINKARDAAMIYWYTGDERYGKFAYDIFNTYLIGMSYRNEPVDLNNGHDQTLVGLSAFEVIHEDILEPLTACYDFLHVYISNKHPQQLPAYAGAFRKWADIIIKNGVPFNNWDLIEARFVSNVALVLEDDDFYQDKHGCQYYLDQILNKTYTRQWALTDLLRKGYNPVTGIWSECPGYSINVLADFTGFVNLFDRTLKTDFLPQMPILPKAVLAQAQYLFPNGSIVGFGDTHYGPIRKEPMEDMIRNARLYKKREQEEVYTRMLKTMALVGKSKEDGKEVIRTGFNSLFSNPPLVLSEEVKAGSPEDYMTATFWSPNVSWFVQRNGTDPKNGLMISEAGSTGNHAHSNGIAMELYGKGIILAPEGGIGGSYFQADYAEYYSQFPAHNTVVVDGISSYPTMKSNHALELQHAYPQSAQQNGYFKGVTFSDVAFLEPETNAAQNRLMSIIRTSDSSGYYIDVFRSAKKRGGDKHHDYIYHNLGQHLMLTDTLAQPLKLQPTDLLTFANEELMGYDYWYDKKSVKSSSDFKARFDLDIPGKKRLSMNMWMKGYPDREIFSLKAPPSRSWRKDELIPDSIANLPLPTVVVRQNGEAWYRPFVAVYEPAEGKDGSSIQQIRSFSSLTADSTFTGVQVKSKNGLDDYILSSSGLTGNSFQKFQFKGTYGVIRENDKGLVYLFLGNGNRISSNDYELDAVLPVAAALSIQNDKMYFTSDGGLNLTIPDTYAAGKEVIISFQENGKQRNIIGKRMEAGRKKVLAFTMPAVSLVEITVKVK
jgi:hypothetical protein